MTNGRIARFDDCSSVDPSAYLADYRRMVVT
jgi:hypothetical protein